MTTFDRFSIGTLSGDELAEQLCLRLETPSVVTARYARACDPHFDWYSSHTHVSELGWWQAEIGTDHGPKSEDNSPVRWRPIADITEDIAVAWRVVEEMKDRGWLFHVLTMTDGFVVNAKKYDLSPYSQSWETAILTNAFVQQPGDTAPEAICRAALDALVS